MQQLTRRSFIAGIAGVACGGPMYDDDDNESVGELYTDYRTPYRVPGTINRPLTGPAGFKRDMTVRWGDTLELRVDPNAPTVITTGEFMRVDLPAARVCSVAFNAKLTTVPEQQLVAVDFTALEVFIGVGASQYIRRLAFSALPQLNADLDFILAELPVNSIHVRASTRITSVAGSGALQAIVKVTGQLTPIESVK